MKVKTADLSSHALQLAVARCEGWVWHTEITDWFGNEPWLEHTDEMGKRRRLLWELAYDTDWSQGGPIIYRERIAIHPINTEEWAASNGHRAVIGASPLVAAMRCYVMSKLGDFVEIPDNLTEIPK